MPNETTATDARAIVLFLGELTGHALIFAIGAFCAYRSAVILTRRADSRAVNGLLLALVALLIAVGKLIDTPAIGAAGAIFIAAAAWAGHRRERMGQGAVAAHPSPKPSPLGHSLTPPAVSSAAPLDSPQELTAPARRPSRPLGSYLVAIAGSLIVLLCAWFVWPTIYRYDRLPIGSHSYPVRINRISGDVQALFPHVGWAPVGQKQQQPQTGAAWTSGGLTATLTGLRVDVSRQTAPVPAIAILFEYTVRNNTSTDRRLPLTARLYKVSRSRPSLEADRGLSWDGDYFPATQEVSVVITLDTPAPPHIEDLTAFVKGEIGTLDRFVVLDPGSRYEITFPTDLSSIKDAKR